MTAGARRASARPMRSLATGLLVLGGAGVVVSGCSSALEVHTPPHSSACEPAAAAWPSRVADQPSRDLDASADAAAWGDPAIIATCGWPALGPTPEDCLDVDGVFWVAERLSDGARFTTFGRDPAIEVLVPQRYAPEPLVLPAFAAAAKALPTNGRTCR